MWDKKKIINISCDLWSNAAALLKKFNSALSYILQPTPNNF